MKYLVIPLLLSVLYGCHGYAQTLQLANSFYNGKYKVYQTKYAGTNYKIYDFTRSNPQIKVKYFAQDAYAQYTKWAKSHRVILACSGAFSDSFEKYGKPVGLTIDYGKVVNRYLNKEMDGLVIVYNEGHEVGKFFTLDIEREALIIGNDYGSQKTYNISNSADRYRFISYAQAEQMTVFQTQLMYANGQKRFPTDKLYYGKSASRRFLVKAKRYGVSKELIVDISKDEVYLNNAANRLIELLEYNNYQIDFILNLDTGGKDILYSYNENGSLLNATQYPIYKATNLLVYYYAY